MSSVSSHKSGFVSIIGLPNAGKSTLMNSLIGEKLSIVTPKAQTTRHRIFGILNGDDYQIVFSDTPGIIKPKYELQKSMMKFVSHSLEDADLVLYIMDVYDKEPDAEIVERLKKISTPVVAVVNKIDTVTEITVSEKTALLKSAKFTENIIPVSALKNVHISLLLEKILSFMPLHPPYFDKEELSDKPERFFAAEIIREKIFMNYQQEIPYSCEVVITGFKEKQDMNVISAEIIVERESQKGILIGKKGESLKKVGTQAREEMEKFFGRKVFLEQHVRVIADWRSNPNALKKFGYEQNK